MKKQLFNEQPLITCYPEYSLLFSLAGNKINNWIATELLQVRVTPQIGFVGFCEHENLFNRCPFILREEKSAESFSDKKEGLIDLVISSVDANKCLFLYMDRFYIDGLEEYKGIHYIHKSIVVGYDTDERCIYIADNFSKGRFQVVSCKYADFLQACCFDTKMHVLDSVLTDKYQGRLCDYAEQLIKENGKTFVYVNRKLIGNLHCEETLAHELEIVGVNPKDRTFDVVYKYGLINKKVKCSFDELEKAYIKDIRKELLCSIDVISQKSDDSAVPDRQTMIEKLKSYLDSKGEDHSQTLYENYFGIEAEQYLYLWIARNGSFRMKIFHFLFEHKLLMELRVNMLVELGLISSDSAIISEVAELKKRFFMLRNIAIKYIVSRSKDDLSYLLEKFEAAIDTDMSFCKKLVEELEGT